ncbi:hypothetical protein G3570_11585 [Balneolaceae bacterium YR4-1]|uniref:Uncharacterized protein n=1 Tax=Halalkalibaculum roseum TaxID=2709311 RepID=A0A6M1SPI4_9BACT|nr:hypothetical protein [Halalkalibaculum roseum]NGP77281.1 hypothetical protein [Halalkalibaculum roseum]
MSAIIFFASDALAQNLSGELELYNQDRLNLNKTGMLVLSGWALGNIAIGSYGYFRTGGKTKYFHQMNAAWNLVNLSIGAFAYYNYLHTDPASFSLAQSMREAKSLENILLLNIGLDVGYIATGAFLWEKGIRKDNNRLLGYGPSLILQGGFLLVFDGILYGLNRTHNEKLFNLMDNLSISANAISVTIPL